MHRRTRWFAAVLIAGIALPLSACAQVASSTHTPEVPPATVEPIGDTGLSRLTLTESAVARLAVQTVPVAESPVAPPTRAAGGDPVVADPTWVIPYAALLYQPDGATFVYTNPEPRTYVREAVTVREIVGNQVLVTAGPATGVAVVTTGAAELWGTEFKIGKY